MSLIARRSSLIINSVAAENPQLPVVPSLDNCWVYHYRHEDDENGWCYIRGRAGSGLAGKRLVKYRKLELPILFMGCTLAVSKIETGGVGGYLGQINSLFGLDLTLTDIINHPIGANDTSFELEVLNTHTLYRGKVTFTIGLAAERLGTLITARELEPIIDTASAVLYMPPAILSYAHDYSSISSYLETLYSGYLITDSRAATMASALKSVDSVPWGIIADTIYSLVNATVVYRGLTKNSGYPDLVKTEYSNVLIVKPVHSDTTRFGDSFLVFHYNIYDAVRS